MAEADLHLKLDRILANQEAQSRQMADMAEASAVIVQAVQGLVPLLGTLREMLRILLDAASDESAGGNELAELIRRVEAQLKGQNETLEMIRAMLLRLPGEVKSATIDGVLLASGEGVPPRPRADGGAA